MHFLSQGDYNFPFSWSLYWAKHVYMWSFQTGTPNPDGFIRLPGRILNFLVFITFGHLAVSYFYALSSLLIAGLAFYFFSREFLKLRLRSVRLLSAVFFAINPVFLGNLAKVGLILAVAMLPLCLLFIRKAFETKQLRYFVLWLVVLNISFMHPYTLAVNAVITVTYLAWQVWHNRPFVVHHLFRFILLGLLAILLNLYLLLPIASLGTLSKDVISADVTQTQNDYTNLVDFSNTGDIFTGLTLAKNVFLDFNFYNDLYHPIYLIGVLGFYVLLITAFIATERFFNAQERRNSAIFLMIFLALILLATTVVFNIDILLKLLIRIPGGWAFRSPLKWQLYIPVALFSILGVVLDNLGPGRTLRLVQASLVAAFVCMNGYLAYDVIRLLLVPRAYTHFNDLAALNLDGKTLLFVNSPACMDFQQNHPRVVTELNQVFVSQDVEVKRVLIDDLPNTNAGSYDYAMTCTDNLKSTFQEEYAFTPRLSMDNHIYNLYKNTAPRPPLFALDHLYTLPPTTNVDKAFMFARQAAGTSFAFTSDTSAQGTATLLSDVFAGLNPHGLQTDLISTDITPSTTVTSNIYQRHDQSPLYYRMPQGNQLLLSNLQTNGYLPLSDRQPVSLNATGMPIHVTYSSPGFAKRNLITNPSLEQGLWQSHVGDCYHYDEQPKIGMQLDGSSKTDGNHSLLLTAARHIACTGPASIPIVPGAHYLLSFDYQSSSRGGAGYNVAFDNIETSTLTRRLSASANWQPYSQEIVAPLSAHHMRLLLFAYPGLNDQSVASHYDNLSLSPIPALQDKLYVIATPKVTLQNPVNVQVINVNPTLHMVHISGATKPFYLASNDSYHRLWELAFAGSPQARFYSLNRAPLASTTHIRLSDGTNGWFIDPATLCKFGRCTHTSEGYAFNLAVQFVPQHWFYLGALVSGVTWLSTLTYFGYLGIRKHVKAARPYRWR